MELFVGTKSSFLQSTIFKILNSVLQNIKKTVTVAEKVVILKSLSRDYSKSLFFLKTVIKINAPQMLRSRRSTWQNHMWCEPSSVSQQILCESQNTQISSQETELKFHKWGIVTSFLKLFEKYFSLRLWIRPNLFLISSHKKATFESSFYVMHDFEWDDTISMTIDANRYGNT